jgi:hypothetical protein
MNHCVVCGTQLSDTMTLCPHHQGHEIGWAETNRIMCNLLHRGIIPRRLRAIDRDEELRGCLQEAA